MAKERFQMHATIGLLLIKDNKVLLMKRCNTGYMDGYYGMVAGHLEQNESLKQAIVREAFEEVGIILNEENIRVVCMVRRASNDNYFNYFLTAETFEGVPTIKPDKCEELIWCDINDLPENTIMAEKRAIYNYLNGVVFDEYDFIKKK